ncbi:hypothetical protein [Micromonospora sp. DT233]|uniref:hypothetical protein n=1 Tax=Micromonospora sp. DT233 TaxID=3393432 RepID=UPI003CF28D33
MTSPAEPAPGDAAPAPRTADQARQLTAPLRELIAFVLLGANALLLFVGLLRLIAPAEYTTFYTRAGGAFSSFVGLEATVLPVLAVLLATHIAPVVPRAKLLTLVALGEYAFGAVLGVLTLLIWTVDRLADAELLDALLGLLGRAAWLALFGTAAYVVFRIWRAMFFTPKPKPAPGVYGQPQPGWPQQHPGQQGAWGAAGQQGWPTAGQQPGGYPSAPGQPGGYPAPGQPGGQYGQPTPQFTPAPSSAPPSSASPYSAPPFTPPQSAPPAATPYSAPPFTPPASAPPFTPPASAPPASAPPAGQSSPAEPTQAIPRPSAPQPAEPTQAIPSQPGPGAPGGQQGPDDDRTQRIQRED